MKSGEKTAEKATKKAKANPPAPTKMVVPSADELRDRIRAALQDQECYSTSLEFAIAVAAGNYHAYLKCLASMSKRAKVMYPILTREGSKAYKVYPDIEHLPSLSKALKESLHSLGLTLDTIEVTDDDPLNKLQDKVSDILNG